MRYGRGRRREPNVIHCKPKTCHGKKEKIFEDPRRERSPIEKGKGRPHFQQMFNRGKEKVLAENKSHDWERKKKKLRRISSSSLIREREGLYSITMMKLGGNIKRRKRGRSIRL